jgi:hypothetical protein
MRQIVTPLAMALGLGMLIAAGWWPQTPVVSAMALVALGATGATVVRLSGQGSAVLPLLAVHLFVYSSLYLLMIGSACHSASSDPERGWHLLKSLDLVASLGPIALAARWSATAITHHTRGEDATPRSRR